jgi:hypothetical protein
MKNQGFAKSYENIDEPDSDKAVFHVFRYALRLKRNGGRVQNPCVQYDRFAVDP